MPTALPGTGPEAFHSALGLNPGVWEVGSERKCDVRAGRVAAGEARGTRFAERREWLRGRTQMRGRTADVVQY